MIYLKLSPRLQKIADSIYNCDTLADIGTDHAYLPIYLVRKEAIKHAIASDINKGPIDIAESRIKANKLEAKIETRLGSGLTVLNENQADVIVIAGMGGMLIVDIISARIEVARSADMLVLQPMLDSGKLRAFLMDNGFEIFDEELAKEERKLYEILWVRKTEKLQEKPKFLDIGSILIEKKHPLLKEFIDKKIFELQNVIKKLEEADTEGSQRRLEECTELLKHYNEVRQWV
jgi:tRNA (adenine22-N1)-methyltransferase